MTTGIFESCEDEVGLWLDCLSRTQPAADDGTDDADDDAKKVVAARTHAVLDFMAKAVVVVLRDPYTRAERIRDLVSEAVAVRGDSSAAIYDVDGQWSNRVKTSMFFCQLEAATGNH